MNWIVQYSALVGLIGGSLFVGRTGYGDKPNPSQTPPALPNHGAPNRDVTKNPTPDLWSGVMHNHVGAAKFEMLICTGEVGGPVPKFSFGSVIADSTDAPEPDPTRKPPRTCRIFSYTISKNAPKNHALEAIIPPSWYFLSFRWKDSRGNRLASVEQFSGAAEVLEKIPLQSGVIYDLSKAILGDSDFAIPAKMDGTPRTKGVVLEGEGLGGIVLVKNARILDAEFQRKIEVPKKGASSVLHNGWRDGKVVRLSGYPVPNWNDPQQYGGRIKIEGVNWQLKQIEAELEHNYLVPRGDTYKASMRPEATQILVASLRIGTLSDMRSPWIPNLYIKWLGSDGDSMSLSNPAEAALGTPPGSGHWSSRRIRAFG